MAPPALSEQRDLLGALSLPLIDARGGSPLKLAQLEQRDLLGAISLPETDGVKLAQLAQLA